MPLILAPSFDEHTREEIEDHIAAVQARRMVAAMEYHAGKHTKLDYESEKIKQRMEKQYELLRKEIAALEKAEEKVIARLDNLTNLKNEVGLITDMMELHTVPTEQEDE